MRHEDPCPKCGSSERIPDVRMRPGWGESTDVVAEVDQHPHALLLKGTVNAPLRAVVCAQCGFAELYVKGPEELLAAYRVSRSP